MLAQHSSIETVPDRGVVSSLSLMKRIPSTLQKYACRPRAYDCDSFKRKKRKQLKIMSLFFLHSEFKRKLLHTFMFLLFVCESKSGFCF